MVCRGTVFPSAGDVWRELQRNYSGQEPPRVSDDDVESRFWKHYIRERGDDGPDSYSRDVWAAVSDIMGERYWDSILEIGPGWGNYTFDLAERCRMLTCVDQSPDVLRHISRAARENGLRIGTVESRWEDYTGKGAELVFGFNCFYRMREIEDCLRKIDEKGADLHIVGMTSGPEQEFLRVYEEELGYSIRYTRLDYIVLVNVLYQLGIDCNVRVVDLERDYSFPSVPQAARKFERRVLSKGIYCEDDAVRILRRYLRKEPDGLYHYHHRFKGALIYW